jgi:parallel beta-helix repeat protein
MKHILTALFLTTLATAAPTFYVATNGDDANTGTKVKPFATIMRARDAARGLTAIVQIRGGTYRLTEPIVFTQADSGTVYEAAPGERPVFSGGRVISGWQRGEGKLWKAQVPDKLFFNQLFVNGERRRPASIPNEGYLRTQGPLASYTKDRKANAGIREIRIGFKFKPGDLKSAWHNPNDIRLFLYHSWTASLHWLDRVDEESATVRFTNQCGWPVGYWEKEQRYRLEHVREGLDAPGEWYLDRTTGLLEYFPMPGENMNKVEVVAPVLTRLITIEGTHDITLRGLSFQHADWNFADKTQSADGQAAAFLDAAVQARDAQHVTFENCEIAHIGTYALWLEAGCKSNRVVHCEIHDLGAGGVRIGETMRQKTASKTNVVVAVAVPELTMEGTGARDTGHNVVDNNFIHDAGHVFPAGIGVFIGHSAFNEVTHNEICDLFYSPISVGWVWGFGKSVAHHNRIAHNHLHHYGWGVLSDMGAVYTLGPSPGTVVANNLVHHANSYSYGGWGLYTDEGSSDIVLENNVVFDTKTGGFHQHYGANNIVRNNIIAFSREAQIQRSREDVKNSFSFTRNIVYCDNDQVLTRIWKNGDYLVNSNVYWSIGKSAPLFAGNDWDDWRATSGQDKDSLLADPLFENAARRDFRLKKNSPAFKIGFQPIDLKDIGLYGERDWVNKPKQVKRAEFVLPQTAAPTTIGLDEDFEQTPVGEKPKRAHISGDDGNASCRVTRETAATGKHSLKFTDAPGLAQVYQPHLFYQPRPLRRRVRVSLDLRVEPGAIVVAECRDAGKPYRVGPSIRVDGTGQMTAGKKPLLTVPQSQWFHIEMTFNLGKDSTGVYDLAVTLPGQKLQTFPALPFGNKQFDCLQWFGFMSMANAKAVYYLDNLKIAPVK